MKNSIRILAKIWVFYFLMCCLIFALSKNSYGYYGYGGLGGIYGSSLYGGSSLSGLGGGLYSSLGGYGLGGLGMSGLGGYGGYGLGSSLYGGSSYGLGGGYGLGSVGGMYYGNITGSPSNSGRAIYFGAPGFGATGGLLYGGLSGYLGMTNPLLSLSSLGGITPAVTAEQAGVWQGTWSAGFLFADMTLIIVENPTTGFLSGTVTLAGNFAIPTPVDVYGTATPYSVELSGIDPAGLYAVSINGILNSPTQMTGTWAIVKVSTGIVAKVLGVDQVGSFEVTLVNAPVFAPTAVAPAVIAPTVAPTAIAPTIIQPTTLPLIFAPTVSLPTVFSPTIIAPTVISPTIIAPPIIAPTVIPPITSILPAAILSGLLYAFPFWL